MRRKSENEERGEELHKGPGQITPCALVQDQYAAQGEGVSARWWHHF